MVRIPFKRVWKALLYLIVFGCERCFYLVNEDAVNVSGLVNIRDVFLLLALIFTAWVYLRYGVGRQDRYAFWWVFAGAAVLSLLSSFQSWRLYGQSFLLGLRPQRFFLVWGLLYFPLRRLMILEVLTVEELKTMIFRIGTIELVLYVAQYVLGDLVTFLHVNTNLRYGETRYYFDNLLLRLLLFLNLDRVFRREKLWQSLAYMGGVLFVLLMVGKMRMTSLATLLAAGFGLLIWKRGGKTKAGILLLALAVGAALLNTTLIQDSLSQIDAMLSGGGRLNSSLRIRREGRELYLNAWAEHPILAGGYINSLHGRASTAAGFHRRIYLVDNGFWSFFFLYGTPGLIWAAGLFAAVLCRGWKLCRRKGIYWLFLAPLGWLMAGQTELHWYWNNGFFYMMLVLVCLEWLTGRRKKVGGQ